MKTKPEIHEYRLPAYWASYYINGDASGISEEERSAAEGFLAAHKLPKPCSCSESYFARTNDATTLAGDVCDYQFLIF